MTHALAKQLELAGFPFSKSDIAFCNYIMNDDKPVYMGFRREWLPEDAQRLPTLGDLIFACGRDFVSLKRTDMMWLTALGTKWIAGYSPEETVAKLWLAINESKHDTINTQKGLGQHDETSESQAGTQVGT